MRILIHSNGPMVPSGYGRQVALLAPRLAAAGHDVAISAFYGLSGSAITWEGIPIYPAGQMSFGTDVLLGHARSHRADVVITLMDFWKLDEIAPTLKGLPVLAWLPVDCTPLGRPDLAALDRSGAVPVAMSEFGRQQLIQAGFAGHCVPHMVDTAVMRPPADRQVLRESYGIAEDSFLVGICAANRDALRKGWPEQFEAFRRFAEDRPEARLLVHSVARSTSGFALDQLAHDMHIADKVTLSDQHAQITGQMGPDTMAEWFGMLDVLSVCSYAEAFGVPLIEAQACGTPVVATDGSAMSELSRYGWRVKSDPYWNPVHRAWWDRPQIPSIAAAYYKAWLLHNRPKMMADRRRQVAGFAALFDADRVVKERWLPLLDELAADGVSAPALEWAPEGEQE